MKRAISLILALLLTVSLCVPAFASGEPAADLPAIETPAEDTAAAEEAVEAAPAEEPAPATGDAPVEETTAVLVEPADQPVVAANSGKCGDGLTWTLSGGTLTISGTGKMNNFTGNAPWGKSVKSVVIKNGATNIGAFAFDGCESLTSVSIPNSVASIDMSAFQNCKSLQNVVIPNSVTTIGDFAFTGCISMTTVTIPDSVTTIGEYAFNGNILTSIVIPASVTTIEGNAFAWCYWLTSITVMNPNCNIHTITDDPVNPAEVEGKTLGMPGITTVHGYNDSTAEAFARKYGYEFIPLSGPVPTAPPKPTSQPTPTPAPAKKDGLVTENGKTYFYVDGVKQVNKLVTAQDGKMYYCASDGHIMKGGVQKVGGKFYYLSPSDGHVVKGGWIAVSGKNRYYADKDGALYTGYVTIGSKSYYFSVNDAHLMKGGIVTGPGGKQYYVSANDGHAMKGGWARGLKVKGRTGYSYYYYLDKDGAVRVTRELPTSTKISSLAIPKPSEYQN